MRSGSVPSAIKTYPTILKYAFHATENIEGNSKKKPWKKSKMKGLEKRNNVYVPKIRL